MKHFAIITVAIICAVLGVAESKTFTQCELAKLLYRTYKFDKAKVNNFVCLAQAESSLNTVKTHKNSNGSTDYGLFQINNKYWCSSAGYSSSNECKLSCADLLTNDISKAVSCANKIYARHGYSAWYGWKAKCKSGVKDLSSCM